MCEYQPGEPWYSYVFRQVCEKSLAVLAVIGFIMLFWYADKADKQQEQFIRVIKEQQEFTHKMTLAVQELTHYIKTSNDSSRN